MVRKLSILNLLFLFTVSWCGAKENDVEIVLGSYWNSYSNKSLLVSAIVDDDNELTLFFEIPVNHRGVLEMKLEIKEKNIPALRNELLSVKRLRNMYIESMKDYGVNSMKDKMGIKYPPMRLWWKVGDYWSFSEWERSKPVFLAEKGIYSVYVETQTQRDYPLQEELIKYGVAILGGIILGEDATAAALYEVPEFITFKWGFSTQKDIMTIVEWLDVDELKKKYQLKKR